MQRITSNPISQHMHTAYKAVDFSANPDPDYYAPEDGTITNWGDSGTCGLRLELTGASGRHGFCHNEKTYVKVGQKVKRGQKLARMGYTGYTQPDNVPAGTHVHWVILQNGKYVYAISLVNEKFKKLTEEEDEMVTSKGQLRRLFLQFTGKEPTKADYDGYINKRTYAYTVSKLSAVRKDLPTVLADLKACQAGYTPVTEQLFKKKG